MYDPYKINNKFDTMRNVSLFFSLSRDAIIPQIAKKLIHKKINIFDVSMIKLFICYIIYYKIIMPMYDIGIFIFRRDLRIHDNIGLTEMTKRCKKIVLLFIFDPYQIDHTKQNKNYRSDNAIQFMCETLIDLYKQTDHHLHFFYGTPHEIIRDILSYIKKSYSSILIGFNLDFTEYALKRDILITKICKQHKIDIYTCDHDHTLVPFDYMVKSDKTAYMVFNAFYTNASKNQPNVPLPSISIKQCIYISFPMKTMISTKLFKLFYTENKYVAERGGRSYALTALRNKSIFNQYETNRDMLFFRTYQISAYLNFGSISVREAYSYLKKNEIIVRQLYWRDFYNCILRYTPFAISYQRCINKDYEKIKWNPNEREWKALMQSKTGFLMIDAAMRELIQTGYIGNRVRLILGSFWIKYLRIHPLHPKYGSNVGFSMYLVDCSASQNKLNHQWLLELDRYRFAPKQYRLSGRPFRIDNEMIKKYDPDCIYIKKWLPIFKNVTNQDIYKWNSIETYKKYKLHVPPIFDWKERYNQWLQSTKNI